MLIFTYMDRIFQSTNYTTKMGFKISTRQSREDVSSDNGKKAVVVLLCSSLFL